MLGEHRLRTLFIIPLVLMSLVSFPSWGLTIDDLVERNDINYEKFTDIPFTGEVEGKMNGSFKNGKREGYWVIYHDNGQLMGKGEYKNGKQIGFFEIYHDNGQLQSKGVINKNDEMEGEWVGYNEDGTVWKDLTGTFKNGVKVGD